MTTQKLDPEFKEKWTSALRSGEYKQGVYNVLYDAETNTYCCLGVACVIAGASTNDLGRSSYVCVGEDFQIPKILTGVPSENPVVKELTYMNDGYDRKQSSFLEIADWIDANL